MKPIAPEDILNLHEYELARQEIRARVIEKKRARRVALGPLVTLVFENRDTVLFQIQEMLRVERIVRPDRIQQEIDVYNDLLPRAGEVAATLFIEVTDPAKVQPVLDGFLGLEEPGRLAIRIEGEAFGARFAPGQSREDRISAVHYIRFPIAEGARRALASGAKSELVLDHPFYSASVVLSPETVEELAADLEEENGAEN